MAGGPPPALVGRVGRLGAIIASDPIQLKATVAGSVRELVSGGLRTMVLVRLRRSLVMTLAGVLVGGAVLYADARSGQLVADGAQPQGRQAEFKGEEKERIEIPSPDQLRASSGRGKALLYRLDEKQERIPLGRDGKVTRFQEVEREFHWAVITGVINYQQVQKSLIRDKEGPVLPAWQLFSRVELKRQSRREDGSWMAWEKVNPRANLEILDNLAYREAERVPEPFRLLTLVDPLPRLTQGAWTGVDVEDFLPGGGNAGRSARRSS